MTPARHAVPRHLRKRLVLLNQAVFGNYLMLVQQYAASESMRTMSLALLATVGRFVADHVTRDVAVRWFTRAYDNDAGWFPVERDAAAEDVQ